MRILSKKKNHLLQSLSSTFNFAKKSSTFSSVNSINYPSPLHIPISNQWLKTAAAAVNNNNHHKLLLKRSSPTKDKYEFSLLSAQNSSATHHFSLPSLPFPEEDLEIAPSCDGLLHIYNEVGLDAAIWNPSTMEIKFLPPCDIERPPMTESTTTELSAFGFDSKAQDYKVVRFVVNYIDKEGPDNEFATGTFQTEIESYSFKTGLWKRVFSDHKLYFKPSVYVDGCFYWNGVSCIASFDFGEEKLSTLYWPHIGKRFEGLYEFDLVDFDGSLGCIVCPKFGSRKTYEVWVMKGGGLWSKEVNVHVSGDKRLLGFWGNGQVLFLEVVDGNGGLLAYDCTTNLLKRLDISFDPEKTVFIPYVESKLPLDEQLATGKSSSGNKMGFIPYVRSMVTPDGQMATCNISAEN